VRACRRTEARLGFAHEPLWLGASARLLQFDDRTLRFELLFDFFSFLLGHAFLYRSGRAFDRSFASFRPRLVIARTSLIT